MRILAIERDQPDTGQLNLPEILREEAASVWDLQKRGIIRDIWFTDGHCAIIMLECQSAAEARRQLAALPLVQHGFIDFTLHELHSYDGFERLFAATGPVEAKPKEPAEY